jgi:hypothetical protein
MLIIVLFVKVAFKMACKVFGVELAIVVDLWSCLQFGGLS